MCFLFVFLGGGVACCGFLQAVVCVGVGVGGVCMCAVLCVCVCTCVRVDVSVNVGGLLEKAFFLYFFQRVCLCTVCARILVFPLLVEALFLFIAPTANA